MKKATTLFVFALMLAIPMLAQGHSVQLNWLAGVGGDPAAGFHVQRSSTSGSGYVVVGTTTPATLTYTDNNVVSGQTYYYVVTAFNSAGESGPTNEYKAVVVLSAPNAPTNLTGTPKITAPKSVKKGVKKSAHVIPEAWLVGEVR